MRPRKECLEIKFPKDILYRISPYNGGVVFAKPERARCVDRIHRAMTASATWAEFRKAMPREEYSRIVRLFDDNAEARPRGSDSFDASQVPGFCDGDYPPWLQREMDGILPQSFFHRYAKQESTVHNGSYWMIPTAVLEVVLRALRMRGYDVREAADLLFH